MVDTVVDRFWCAKGGCESRGKGLSRGIKRADQTEGCDAQAGRKEPQTSPATQCRLAKEREDVMAFEVSSDECVCSLGRLQDK